MKKILALFGLLLVSLQVLAGCTNQNKVLIKENEQLKQEITVLKQEISEINEINEEIFMLRNTFDKNLYNTLIALVKGDYESAKLNLAPEVKIIDKKLIFNINGKVNEFLIPDRQMNLRQRTFFINEANYAATYEIYDAGYEGNNTYNDRINTLNVSYIKHNGDWKISNIQIDE